MLKSLFFKRKRHQKQGSIAEQPKSIGFNNLVVLIAASTVLLSSCGVIPEVNAIAPVIQFEVVSTSVSNMIPSPTPIVIIPEPSLTSTPIPLPPTSTPTLYPPTPTPKIYCDWMSFVKDITIPDGTTIKVGGAFVKTWRLKNRGTCTWTPDYALVFSNGMQMGNNIEVKLPEYVAPGNTIDISIPLTAPSTVGHHRSYWLLRNASGVLFGYGDNANKTFFVDIYAVDGSNPAVTISPSSGPSGTLVQVVASGFLPNSQVLVGLGPVNSEYGQVAQGFTNGNGDFNVQVPARGEVGLELVFAVAVQGQPGVLAPLHFYITEAIPAPTPYLDTWTTFSSPAFAISLQYPAEWQPVPGYGDSNTGVTRYGGVNGFFQIGAMDTDSIDKAAAHEAEHRLKPYGSNPTIETLQIQGQEARLILPSGGQPAGMQNQAALIVQYPFVASIVWSPRYFVLYADWPHIRTIAETLRFAH
ncbi:MAG: hypothetical protein ISR59_00485 [Anaerolineales bacterium]|uniref:Nbr1 FW domain-containing protein n=1 Tax=Candidatus Desulfolinea nitratireducens TaxID=2841698 RepID=A0A8J6TJ40_9CHLR|nr:hypothetical protein [Candidatus Desulfolinea nitratireducens]MBL6959554.1 hypothetical protein [Anaerolineales bacterium]